MKGSIRLSLMAALASIADLLAAETPTKRRYTRPIYSNGGRAYTRGKRFYSQRTRSNRRKARRLKRCSG